MVPLIYYHSNLTHIYSFSENHFGTVKLMSAIYSMKIEKIKLKIQVPFGSIVYIAQLHFLHSSEMTGISKTSS